MFSPVKAMIGGALVFALGGVLLIAQPFDQQGGVPGAEQGAEPMAPVAVTGTVTSQNVQSYGSTVEEDGIYLSEGVWWTITWEASDPRLSGQGTVAESLATDDVESGMGAHTIVLVNPDGRWVGSGHGFWREGEGEYQLVVLQGEGAHDGLTATVLLHSDEASHTFEGMVFPGEVLTIPEPVEPPTD